MLNPNLKLLLKGNLSRYSLVTATAKRAREIVEEANERKELLTEKPVTLAIEQFLNGEYKIVEPEEIRYI
ncbi:MAG: DNA-directed RNA polymerase subunit omega [Clostridiales bacterium]|jgi:DNA-directed RNA polymerase subunit omega|nr:DNA-directed RNA polymerase subunit omega [Clostridiales bacterium]HOL79820.1 DNA-directed RNA polymerase subunit omega [Clostridiales bacterium]HPP68385.1 DNA-directed RNA polymerase subunit omega [Clostridiales bacterium]HPU67507.1 DNA-directed RNA polymerase subunit omega [Clostridiales bacterium]HQA05421.1 DNA-directed RNA polymerase subunit omega [Clostridiales bacterium]